METASFFSVAHQASSRVCVLHVNSLTTVNILVLVSLYVPHPFPFWITYKGTN